MVGGGGQGPEVARTRDLVPAAPSACRRRARGLQMEAEVGSAELPGGGGKLLARGQVGRGWRVKEEEEVWIVEPTSAAVTWAAGDIVQGAGAGLQSPDPGQPI